jgi:hypothetical protein
MSHHAKPFEFYPADGSNLASMIGLSAGANNI